MQPLSNPALANLPQAVTQNRWFSSLSLALQNALIASSRRIVLRDGQLAMGQGQAVRKRRDGLMVLLEGSLKVSSTHASGREAILSFVKPGQWFGELALMDGQSHARDVRSVGVSEVLMVEPEVFARLMQDADFAGHMAELMSTRTRLLLSLVEDFAMRSARTRTARRLVLLACDDDIRSGPVRKDLDISHDALASMLGMTRQTLAGQLKALAEAGAISQGYGRITISSTVALLAEAAGN